MILFWEFVKEATQKKLLYVNWNLLGELHSVEIEASLVAGGLFFISLFLYAVVYVIERGFTSLSFGTILAAVATALLLASVSVTIEQYIKASLTDHEITKIKICRDLGLQDIQERTISKGIFAGLPDLLDECREEVIILAYAADNFIERKREWIVEALGRGLSIGLLILHPDNLEQAAQTEGRNFAPQTQKTLNYCAQIIENNPPGIENFKVKGYPGHLYFTGKKRLAPVPFSLSLFLLPYANINVLNSFILCQLQPVLI